MTTLHERWRRLQANPFIRSVGVLVSGTVVAQAAAVLALPVLTRIYGPSDFGVLAVFIAMASTVAVAACLRFDIAIPIPERDADGAGLLVLAIVCAIATSLLAALVLLWLPAPLAGHAGGARLAPYLYLLPLAVLSMALYSALQFWFVRAKRFAAIAGLKVVQTIAGVAAQLCGGLLGWMPLGLLIGPIVTAGTGCLGLALGMARPDRMLVASVSWARARSLFAAFVRFPAYSAPEALANSAAIQVPVVLIAWYASGAEAGFVFLAMLALQAPMALVGGAISQVYLSAAPEQHRQDALGTFTLTVFGGLVKAGAGPLLFAALAAPGLFPIVFGSEWARAGVLVAWMAPWFLLQFLSSPVSMALHVKNRQRTALVLQVAGLGLRVGAVLAAAACGAAWISEAYALSGCVFYAAYLAVVLSAVGARWRDVAAQAARGLPSLAAWGAGGILVLAATALAASG